MCGIVGIVGKFADEAHLGPMVAVQARRGPDDHGIWLDPHGGAALGHTRLSIIDLTAAGHQPMTHGGGRFWITYNGEIYNYQELRQELESCGKCFATHTDTEVIIAGWEQWGMDLLLRLRGMFAFALWDRRKRLLALVRDRLGIKPLVWAETPGGLVFASELKALLASRLVEPVIEPRGVLDLLATGSICQPQTMVRGVRSLEPGTCMVLGANTGRKSVRYWDGPASVAALQPELARLSYAEAVQMTRLRLEEACRYHLVADVPVGSFLSGGVDSTAITALMSRYASYPIKTFSVGFDIKGGPPHELAAASLAARHIGCEHTEVVVTGQEVAAVFGDLVRTLDQPSYDGANTYLVSRAASVAVKVALSGLGGDELFAGYPHFAVMQAAQRRIPQWLNGFLCMIHRLRPNRWTYSASLRQMSVPQRYAQLRRGLSDTELKFALGAQLQTCFTAGFIEDYLNPLVANDSEVLRQVSQVECRHYLLNTLLRDADATSMGHGLEVRPVMLDHLLVEHALALPPTHKIRAGRHKAVLKDAVADLLPENLLRRPKTGFELPLGHWLRTTLRARLSAALGGPAARSLFAPAFLQDCRSQLDEPETARLLWTVLVLVTWMDEYKVTLPSCCATEIAKV